MSFDDFFFFSLLSSISLLKLRKFHFISTRNEKTENFHPLINKLKFYCFFRCGGGWRRFSSNLSRSLFQKPFQFLSLSSWIWRHSSMPKGSNLTKLTAMRNWDKFQEGSSSLLLKYFRLYLFLSLHSLSHFFGW